jgi:hypothetical protein
LFVFVSVPQCCNDYLAQTRSEIPWRVKSEDRRDKGEEARRKNLCPMCDGGVEQLRPQQREQSRYQDW